MEDIHPTTSTTKAPEDLRDKKMSGGTLVLQSGIDIDKVQKEQDTSDFRVKTAQSRVEAAKNLEMIRERLKEISTSLNEEMTIRSKNLKFSVDDITNRMLITVLEEDSGKIIKQIPSEAILKAAHNLEALKGIIFDDKY
jgi:flagellar protein FlaG|tara:strand:+ start:369 stop:785 length:417 start_codon:yes stop_codon:yes gene_type:complete